VVHVLSRRPPWRTGAVVPPRAIHVCTFTCTRRRRPPSAGRGARWAGALSEVWIARSPHAAAALTPPGPTDGGRHSNGVPSRTFPSAAERRRPAAAATPSAVRRQLAGWALAFLSCYKPLQARLRARAPLTSSATETEPPSLPFHLPWKGVRGDGPVRHSSDDVFVSPASVRNRSGSCCWRRGFAGGVLRHPRATAGGRYGRRSCLLERGGAGEAIRPCVRLCAPPGHGEANRRRAETFDWDSSPPGSALNTRRRSASPVMRGRAGSSGPVSASPGSARCFSSRSRHWGACPSAWPLSGKPTSPHPKSRPWKGAKWWRR
jgi:hypothetical protein